MMKRFGGSFHEPILIEILSAHSLKEELTMWLLTTDFTAEINFYILDLDFNESLLKIIEVNLHTIVMESTTTVVTK